MRDHLDGREKTHDYEHDPLTHRIIGAALEVHRALGPGLLETTYERAFCLQLQNDGLAFGRQITVPVLYKGVVVGEYRADLIVEHEVVVEIKSVERLFGLHEAQLLAYMRVLGLHTGLLMNFNSEVLKTNIRRRAI